MSGLLRLEEARDRVLAAIEGPLGVESIAPDDALGRVLAEPAVATVSLPPWDNSAMDGYAILVADVAGATDARPARLRVEGDVAAGDAAPGVLAAGSAIRVATGAPTPPGTEAVCPVEATTPLDAGDRRGPRGRDASGPAPAAILVHESFEPGANVRRAGSDLRAGEVILEPGAHVGPAGVALTAGAGLASLAVHRRPRVAVLATGDEIRGPREALGVAGIPDANGPGLRALATASGAEVVDLGIARDALDDVLRRLRRGLAEGADALIVAGGVSVGPYDVVKAAFDALGRIDLWRVAVQPGKPFAFGTAVRPDGRSALLFGLPGNPVSAFVTFELFVRPALRCLGGHAGVLRPTDRAVLVEDAAKSPGRRAFLRVTAERAPDGSPRRDGTGRVLVRLSRGPAGQGSHVLSALATADALAVVPEEVDVHRAGDEVALWWLERA